MIIFISQMDLQKQVQQYNNNNNNNIAFFPKQVGVG